MLKKTKDQIIKTNQLHSHDCGSYNVQIAILKEDINVLSIHLKKNQKDIVCRRILLKKVAKWKKFRKIVANQNKNSSTIIAQK